MRSLLDKILVAQPEKRITLIEVKNDFWYNKDIDESIIAAEKARALMTGG